MEASELKQIAEWLTEAGIASIEITGPRGSVRVTSAGACAADSAALTGGAAAGTITQARATTVGVFLDTHPLRTAPFVRVGDAVKAGDVIGLVKIGRIFVPLSAPGAGIVSRILVESGSRADFGMAILEIHN